MKGRERKRKRERCGASEGNSTANGCQRTTRRRDTNIHYIIFPSLPILSFVPFVPLFPYCDCLSVCLSVCHYSSPFTLRTQLAVLLQLFLSKTPPPLDPRGALRRNTGGGFHRIPLLHKRNGQEAELAACCPNILLSSYEKILTGRVKDAGASFCHSVSAIHTHTHFYNYIYIQNGGTVLFGLFFLSELWRRKWRGCGVGTPFASSPHFQISSRVIRPLSFMTWLPACRTDRAQNKSMDSWDAVVTRNAWIAAPLLFHRYHVDPFPCPP